MFENYENIANNYIPNNLKACSPKSCEENKLESCKPNKPYEDYNAEGKLVGYWWYYGDTVNLDFEITGEVTYEGNDMYLTPAEFLQDKMITIQLYNFRHDEVKIGKELLKKVYRYEDLIIEGDKARAVFPIDKNTSKELLRGVYFISLKVWSDDSLEKVIFSESDAILTVK